MRTITLIAGDGIGPEVTYAARDVVLASGAAVRFEEVPAGERAERELGTALPRAVFDSIDRVYDAGKAERVLGFACRTGFRHVLDSLRETNRVPWAS